MTELRASTHPRLSIVIPAYNEARRLPESLTRVREYVRALAEPCEVLVVDDGSADATARVVEDLAESWTALRLVRRPHRGKGSAVHAGIVEAKGDYIALADADFSMPVGEFARFFAAEAEPFDIGIGSREAPGARRYGEPWYRHLMGRVFNRIVQLLLLPGIEDTQCGFKLLRRAVAREIVPQQTIDGWGFDVELLYIARQRGYVLREVGIDWFYMPDSRISPLRDTLTMLRDVLRIWWNARSGRYAGGVPSPDADTPAAGTPARVPVRDAIPKQRPAPPER